MEEIDEGLFPPKSEEEDNMFMPHFPHKVDKDEGVVITTKLGLKKKIVKVGQGWEVPELGDEIIVNYKETLMDGTYIASNMDEEKSLAIILGKDPILKECEDGLLTMRKGEISIFTVPLTQEIYNRFPGLSRDASLQFQVELISWFKVIDVCNDGGIMKKILIKSEELERPQKKDEVTVIYDVKLEDGSLVVKSPVEGVEFSLYDGHLCPAIEKSVYTMRKGETASLRVNPRYAFGSHGRSAQDGLSAVPPNAVITITLTLVAYKLHEIVTDDHLVIKKIIRCGEGFEKPNSGTTTQIRYIAKLSDGKIFDKKGYDGEDPFEFKVDEEQVIEGLDLAVSTMKRGEVAIVVINHEYGFGEIETNAHLGAVPARSTLYYEVEMLGFTKVTESWDMEPDEKLEYAAKRKEEGNVYFKAEKYRRAALRYDMVILSTQQLSY
ncbi:hypothetical protein AQUCO_02000270v1 [Aquilegia coerulea]|uniref:peptidylprolyl isomerase n=1 Tax=Aquilegia coerulea TaxID=218851 RepID=A0A2G5DGR9_AQUCA|nr:hypothetical protein AQUCO_02000270v1 [Aquilegia coerulea]